MWLAGIAVSNVKAGMRAKLLAYQLEAADVLAAWFLGTSDIPGLAAEMAEMKKRLAASQREHIEEHGGNRVPTCRVNGMSGHCWIAHSGPLTLPTATGPRRVKRGGRWLPASVMSDVSLWHDRRHATARRSAPDMARMPGTGGKGGFPTGSSSPYSLPHCSESKKKDPFPPCFTEDQGN